MTSRRAFVAGALSLLGVPLDAETQTARKVPSIGYLCTYPCGSPVIRRSLTVSRLLAM
jgi:hypothetical protein